MARYGLKRGEHKKHMERLRQVASHRVQYQYSERESVSAEMVCLWLTEHLLDQHAPAFQKAAVDGVTLLEVRNFDSK